MSLAPHWLLVVVAACSSPDPSPRPPPAPATKPVAPAVADGFDADSLGALTFTVTEGTPEARAHFARGLLALHSFWYDESVRQFQAAIDADPTMRMAYWGAAMSRCKLLWGEDDLTAARQILTRMPNPDGLPEREQLWVEATLDLLGDADVRSSRKKFAAAMETVHTRFPDDESTTFLAIALLAAMRPEDSDTTTVRLRAAGLAMSVFEHNPKHPGAAHYAIHALDTPELAARALPLAKAYAQIAPGAYHARHMPAHIFSRLGMWPEAIASCRSAWDASVAAAKREKLSADHHDFHSLNWTIEMSFERGHRKDADAALAVFAKSVREGLGHGNRSLYANQVASYLMRTGDWARIDELLAPLDSPAIDEPVPSGARSAPPQTHCAPTPASTPTALLEQVSVLDARAFAAAMRHDRAATRRFITEIDALRAKLRPFLQTTQAAATITHLDAARARRHLELVARAEGNDQGLVKVLRDSVGDADVEVAAGESLHSGFLAHEELADVLLRLGQAKDAATEYALVLKSYPGRGHSLLGAARAAVKAGDRQAAKSRYGELLAVWANADAETEGLAEARAAVASN